MSATASLEASTGFLLPELPAAAASQLNNFVTNLWTYDVLSGACDAMSPEMARVAAQSAHFGFPNGLLCSPLPIELAGAASGDKKYNSTPQLLLSCGGDAAVLWKALESMAHSSAQSACVAMAAAPTGTGKTHMAYELGRDNAYLVLVRVMHSHTRAPSAPLLWCIHQLEPLVTALSAAPACSVSCSEYASMYLRAVLLAHVHAAVLALQAARMLPRGDDPSLQRLMLLHFFSNGTADEIVCNLLEMLTTAYARPSSVDAGVSCLDAPSMATYEEMLTHLFVTTRGDRAPLLLAVEEAHELMEHARFVRCSHLILREGGGMTHATAKKAATRSTGHGNLFYHLVVLLSEFKEQHSWRLYVTGTSLSMTRILSSAGSSVASRVDMTSQPPRHHMAVDDMAHIIQHYFVVPDGYFDEAVCASLQKFCGRAVLFADGVWKPLLEYTVAHAALPSAGAWCEMLRKHFTQCVETWYQRVCERLRRSPPIALDGSGTCALLPKLVTALLMDDGVLTVSSTAELDAAITTGLLHVSSVGDTVNMNDEPITHAALLKAIKDELMHGHVLDIVVGSSCRPPLGSKGNLLELAIAWHVALTTLRQHDTPSGGVGFVSLRQLLISMGAMNPESVPPEWRVSAHRVIDVAGDDACLQRFISTPGIVDDSIILLNTSCNMGADVVFLAYRDDERKHALVVVQCKNDAEATVADVMLTLHPGTQFLSNMARKLLLGLPVAARGPCALPGRAGYSALASSAAGSFLCRDWIRVPVVARAVAAAVVTYSANVARGDPFSDDCADLNWDDDACAAAAASPVVWISTAARMMHPPAGAFPESVRAAIVGESSSSELPLRHYDLWRPRSVRDADDLCFQLAAASVIEPVNTDRAALQKRRRGDDDAEEVEDGDDRALEHVLVPQKRARRVHGAAAAGHATKLRTGKR